MPPYVPLRVFSSFTMLEGAMEPKAIAKYAAKLGFPAIGLTDRNGLYASMAFGEACLGEGVQPIVGTLLAVARPGGDDSKAPTIDWLALYAQDAVGYDNLCALVSQAHIARLRLDHDIAEGLTVNLTGQFADHDKFYANVVPSSATAATAVSSRATWRLRRLTP